MAFEVSLLVQVKVLPDISISSESFAVAVNCWVAPSSIDGEDGLTVTVFTVGGGGGGGGSVTVNIAEPDTPPAIALIVVDPASSAVASPVELTVATEVLVLSHVKLTF